jgi:hypothetical protein
VARCRNHCGCDEKHPSIFSVSKGNHLNDQRRRREMKHLVSLLAVGMLLISAPLCAQEKKPRTYTLVLEGAV